MSQLMLAAGAVPRLHVREGACRFRRYMLVEGSSACGDAEQPLRLGFQEAVATANRKKTFRQVAECLSANLVASRTSARSSVG